MAINTFPGSGSGLNPAGTAIVNSTQATWPIPQGSKLLEVSVEGGSGGTGNTTTSFNLGTNYTNGATGGTSSVTAGNVTYSATGGSGSIWVGSGSNAALNSRLPGKKVDVFIDPAGLSNLNIQVGSGGSSGVTVTHYV